MISCSLALLVLSRLALGAVTPTAPGPGEVFSAGSECSISWTPDQSGKWKSFSIDLMSGSNSNMTLVANVAEDLDGTDSSLSPYTWTCPDVDPYSTIYFYQFTAANDKPNPAWTTRFTITSSDGEATTPSYSKQPNGDNVPWGIGAMRSGSPVASREKHSGKGSMEEDNSEENYSGDDNEETSQESGNEDAGGKYYDDSEETTSTGKKSKKGGSGNVETSSEDSDDSEVSDDDETTTGTKSRTSKPSSEDAEDDSVDLDTTDSKNSGTKGSDGSQTNAGKEASELEKPVSTPSRMKTVHSKPTSTPVFADNINAANPILPLPSPSLSSAQPVGCAGGTNATSSYCSAPSFANRAIHVSKLGLRTFLVTALPALLGFLWLE